MFMQARYSNSIRRNVLPKREKADIKLKNFSQLEQKIHLIIAILTVALKYNILQELLKDKEILQYLPMMT